MTAEQRLAAFLAHCQLLVQFREAPALRQFLLE